MPPDAEPPARSGPARGADDFTSIPVLSLAAARAAATRPRFLRGLRHALLDVGFAYLSDLDAPAGPGDGAAAAAAIGDGLVESVCEQARLFFDEGALPLAEKERIEMKNRPSFLGWSRVSRLVALESRFWAS
jgi:isopenicillin N synthase-like dioxygenase